MVLQTPCPFNPWTLAEVAEKFQISIHVPDVKSSISLESMFQNQ